MKKSPVEFAGHAAHALAAATSLKSAPLQGAHATPLETTALYVPASHATQAGDPPASAKAKPALQLQLLALTEPCKDWLCGWHAEQLAPSATQKVFAAHAAQAVASATRCAVPCLPAAHAVHEWLPARGL